MYIFIKYISFSLLRGLSSLITSVGWKSFWSGGFDIFNFTFYCVAKKMNAAFSFMSHSVTR